ncbi:SpoIIE family protein phosphatase [Mucisphaera calidilacus]|uniref:Phosphoserine phosphatase RsbU n=1 Tax=Mucisphaera calidilacus TaxID=2527982 RepID=A0A518BWQ5_9BACT|nr:SpoIIE family protein phosphatase [Mucisphaera calidilacus]QDU71401.1 Phosphoserine phosphatase RsbU [Mucisphaera calidilacus]
MSLVPSQAEQHAAPPVSTTGQIALVSVAGPRAVTHHLKPPGPVTIGRRAGNALQLVETDSVSREHATLVAERHTDPNDTPRWFLIDRHSRHGTRLNGIRIQPEQRYPIQPDDLIELTPWVFQVVDPNLRNRQRKLSQTFDDTTWRGDAQITLIPEDQHPQARTGPWMNILITCAETIHAATSEQEVAHAALEAAALGTGYTNAAILRPMTDDGSVPVVAARGDFAAQDQTPSFSRSLIRRAADEGLPTRLSRQQSDTDLAVSVFELGIDEALCVPLKLGTTVAGFLYLDNRHGSASGQRMPTETTDFAVRLAQIVALALSNLMRLDLQQRYARVEHDLAAAAEAQSFVLPERTGTVGPITYAGESRPGRIVSGDFFDVIPLDDHRIALTLGDVVGKGIAASVLMTASQGYVHAAFHNDDNPASVAIALNTFLEGRCADHHFVTLWAAVIDLHQKTLTYVDAGHGYAMIRSADNTVTPLNKAGGLPIGVDPTYTYKPQTIPLAPAGCLVIVSDGIVEQQGRPDDRGYAEEFGFTRLQQLIRYIPDTNCPVDTIYQHVCDHAGTPHLADDATIVAANWA